MTTTSRLEVTMDSASVAAPTLLAQNDLTLHGRAPVTASLLPPQLIELLDLIDCAWASIPLPATVAYASSRISLAELNLLRVGDLQAVPCLTLLALADAARPLEPPLERLWPDALETATAVIAPALLIALAPELVRLFSRQPGVAQTYLSGASSDAPFSALLYEPAVVLDTFRSESSIATSFDLWTPSGLYWSGSRDYIAPQRAPLLTHAVRNALSGTGCDPYVALASLPWRDVRTLRACERQGVSTLGDLLACAPGDILLWRNVGFITYDDIVATLRRYLTPWLAQLPLEMLLGNDARTASYPYQTQQGAVASAITVDTAVPAKPAPVPVTADQSANPFIALAHSDMGAALDLFGVAWRSTPVAELAPQTVRQQLSAIVADYSPSPRGLPGAGSSSPSDEIGQQFSRIAPFLASHPISLDLVDQTLDMLMEASASEVETWRQFPEYIERLIAEIQMNLSHWLLRRVLRPSAFRQGYSANLAMLRQGAIGGLLSDLFLRPYGGALLKSTAIQLLAWRYGLEDGHPQTLESAGSRFGVTRERVRQIEKKALETLIDPGRVRFARVLGTLARLVAQECGGVATLARAAAHFSASISCGDVDPEATLRFISRWSDHLTVTSDSLLITQPYTEELVRRAQQALRDVALAHHDIGRDALIAEAMRAGGAALIFAGARFVAAALDTMSTLTVKEERYQPAGQGSLKSRIVLAMRSLGRPAHFSEIATEYRRLFPEDDARSTNSIHAFFSRFEDTFILVGNGIFALSEWGYDPRIKSVPTLVEHILEQSEEPVYQEDVVERGTERYLWKAQSLRAQLLTNPRIMSLGSGFFGLLNRDYGNFDSARAYDERFGAERASREWLVTDDCINARGHRVLRLRLSPACLSGALPLTNAPMRELFFQPGTYRARIWPVFSGADELALTRSSYDVSGLRPLFTALNARAGDTLFIERLAQEPGSDTLAVCVAFARSDDVAAAMCVVGLSAPGSDSDARDVDASALAVVRNARKPHRIVRLIAYAVEHPSMSQAALPSAVDCVPSNPAGLEYLRLALATGMIATGQPANGAGMVIRPTMLGRRWAFSAGTLDERGRQLVLSLPAYRYHVRALAADGPPDDLAGPETQRIGQRVMDSWDNLCGIISSRVATEALDRTAPLIPTSALPRPALPCLLLLLIAQTQGQGLARATLDTALGGQLDAALRRLRALGLAVVTDDRGRIALAERVDVGIVSLEAVEQTLANVMDDARGLSLAQAWQATLRGAGVSRALRASALYDAVMTLAPEPLYDLLIAPPVMTPEAARFVDAEFPYCGFPTLVADWACAEEPRAGADRAARETIVSYTCRGERGLAPVGIALCDDLLAQPWSVERRLAGNAHLLLLTIIAADEGGLAEGLRRTDTGWRLDGASLLSALDGLLRTLGYDVWDERYRDDIERQRRLTGELVAQAERLGLVVVDGERMEAVSGLATQVYYEACDLGFTERVNAAAHTIRPAARLSSRGYPVAGSDYSSY